MCYMYTITISNSSCTYYLCMLFILLQLEMLKAGIKTLYGDKPLHSSTISKIVSQHHFERLNKLLDDPAVAATVVHGGSSDQKQL